MSAPVFGVDIDCERCGTIHPAAQVCRMLEVSDKAWFTKADGWRMANIGRHVTSEDMTTKIGRPLNPRIIGPLFERWRRAGLVREVRITTAKSKARHHGTLRVWLVL
jgi:hypothetical protein